MLGNFEMTKVSFSRQININHSSPSWCKFKSYSSPTFLNMYVLHHYVRKYKENASYSKAVLEVVGWKFS